MRVVVTICLVMSVYSNIAMSLPDLIASTFLIYIAKEFSKK